MVFDELLRESRQKQNLRPPASNLRSANYTNYNAGHSRNQPPKFSRKDAKTQRKADTNKDPASKGAERRSKIHRYQLSISLHSIFSIVFPLRLCVFA
jgi:hypothetical protein